MPKNQSKKTKPRFNIDLTDKILEKYKRQPKPNQYNVSEIWGILNGYPQTDPGLEDILRMYDGTAKHKFLEQFATGQTEVRKEIDCGDFKIVGKADELTDDYVIEYKTSTKVYDKPKAWHTWQVKFYLTMFEREKGIIYQPIVKDGRFILKCLGTTRRDDAWVEDKINKLKKI